MLIHIGGVSQLVMNLLMDTLAPNTASVVSGSRKGLTWFQICLPSTCVDGVGFTTQQRG